MRADLARNTAARKSLSREYGWQLSQSTPGMFQVLRTSWLAPGVKRLEVHAPRISRKQQPGQFVIVRVHDHGERIPLTIAAADAQAGTVTLIVQTAGKTTDLLNRLQTGQAILDVVGPLGRPSDVRKYGTVAVIGGGVGTAIAWPTAKAMKAAGNRVLAIIGARSSDLVILADEMRHATDELFITTDDGTLGEKGFVSDLLKRLIEQGEKIDYVLAIGPIPMMRAVAEVTRPHGIRTDVSLNSIMVDGTGMCGGCRVLVGGEAKFACVDGPEFDAHLVNFDVLAQRNALYREAERRAWEQFQKQPERDLVLVNEACRLAEQYPEVARLTATQRGALDADEAKSQRSRLARG
jgi:ferredoxin--NADP+ reductase